MGRERLIPFSVCLVLCLAVGLRFVGLGDLTIFESDQAFDCSHLASIVGLHAQPSEAEYWALGPYAGVGGFYGPFFYYLMALPFWIAGGNPAVGAYVVASLNLLAIFLVYRLARTVFDPVAGVIVLVLFSTSAAVTHFARFMWSPNLLPLFSAALCLAVVTLRRESNAIGYLATGLLLGCYLQLHVVAWGVMPFVLIYLGFFRRRYRAGGVVLATLAACVALGPWLWREAMFFLEGSQVSLLASALQSVSRPRPLGLRETLRAHGAAMDWLIGLPMDSLVGPVLFLGLGGPALVRSLVGRSEEQRLVWLYFVCQALFTFLAPQQVYRLQALFFLLLLFLAAQMSAVWRSGHQVLVAVAVTLLSLSSLHASLRDISGARADHPGIRWATLGNKLRIAEHILNDADGRRVRVEFMRKEGPSKLQPEFAYEYRYLLRYLGYAPEARREQHTYWIVRVPATTASSFRRRSGVRFVAREGNSLVFRVRDDDRG